MDSHRITVCCGQLERPDPLDVVAATMVFHPRLDRHEPHGPMRLSGDAIRADRFVRGL
jgi:hypothetical protein